MKEPIFVVSHITRRCPFSKNIIKPKTMLCIFNKYQYDNFAIEITRLLSPRLPDDIINIIIEFTNYRKLLNRVRLEKFVNWQDEDYKSSRSMIRLKIVKIYYHLILVMMIQIQTYLIMIDF